MAETVLEVASPKALAETVVAELAKRMHRAVAALDKAAKPAIEMWLWAFEHVGKGYRPVLKIAEQKPNGWLQRAYEVARAVAECNVTVEDLTEAAGSPHMDELAAKATEVLKANGLKKGHARKPRTDLEQAAKVMEYVTKVFSQMDLPVAQRAVSNPSCPRLKEVPSFNVRECVERLARSEQYSIVLLTEVPPSVVREMVGAGETTS